MSTTLLSRFNGVILAGALLLPASGALAMERDSQPRHRHGALKGAAVGALVARHHRVRGGLVGAAAGAAIQHHRNKRARYHNPDAR
jgi:hypothetical protein